MDESKSFRRAFLAGVLTLGVALSGQMVTSGFDAPGPCSLRTASASYLELEAPAELGFVQVEPRTEAGLAERVARAVIGAVLNGFV